MRRERRVLSFPTLVLSSWWGSGGCLPSEGTTPGMRESWTSEGTAYKSELEVSSTQGKW